MKLVIDLPGAAPLGFGNVGATNMTLLETAMIGHWLGTDPTLIRLEHAEKVIDFKDAREMLKANPARVLGRSPAI
jgi:hypothetical protein